MAQDRDPSSRAERSFGVFKPVGHVVISLPGHEAAEAAERALREAGLVDDVAARRDRDAGIDSDTGGGGRAPRLRRFDPATMIERIDADIAAASPLAAVGQEMNLAKSQRELAQRGYHFIVIKADDDEAAQRVAEIAQRHGAERAQFYGSFLIEELISRADDLPQVGESPDRGLDAQTLSGLERERIERHAPQGGAPSDEDREAGARAHDASGSSGGPTSSAPSAPHGSRSR